MRKNKFFKDILITLLGTFLAGFGMGNFLLPNKLSSGGFSGIATIFYYFFNWNVGIVVVILNIPFFIWAVAKIGKRFFAKTIVGTVSLSVFIDFFEGLPIITQDRLLASIYGGVLIGVGTALIFKAHTSTGGTDLIVQILHEYNLKITSSKLLNLIDILVVVINVLFFGEIDIGLYSAIAIFIDGIMIDVIFEGINFSKMVYIISGEHEKIVEMINRDLDCGATEFYGKGSYSAKDIVIVMSVVNRREIPNLREKINEIDKDAFLIVTNAREVYGTGFKDI